MGFIKNFFNKDSKLIKMFRKKNIEEVLKLLDKGANPNLLLENGKTLLTDSIERNDIDFVELLLKHATDSNLEDNNGKIPLFLAVNQNRDNIISLLLESNIDLNKIDKKGNTILNLAIRKDNIETIRKLLNKGINVNIKNLDGTSSLNLAVHFSNISIIKKLLDFNADPNSKDKDGVNPLIIAIKEEKEPVIKLLLDSNVDINSTDIIGLSALSYALLLGNIAILNLLFEKGANPNSLHSQDTPISSLFFVIGIKTKNKPAVIDLLIKKGADINWQSPENLTVLMMVAGNGDIELLKLLISSKAEIDKIDNDGLTALTHAIFKGNYSCAEQLLKAGANLNIVSKDGLTPLVLAVEKCPEIAMLLIENNADINVICPPYDSPVLGHAIQIGNNLLVRKLLEKGADPNIQVTLEPVNDFDPVIKNPAILYAVLNNNIEVVKSLLEFGADPNTMILKSANESILITYVCRGEFEIVELLLEKGADVNIRDSKKLTALRYAINLNNEKMVDALLSYNADPNLRYDNDMTDLMGACLPEFRNLRIANSLLNHNAEVNVFDKMDGKSPLIYACAERNNDFTLISTLIDNGADMYFHDKKYDFSILHWAIYYNDFELINFLISKGFNTDLIDCNKALKISVISNNPKCLHFFLQRNANPDIKTNGSIMVEAEIGIPMLCYAINAKLENIAKILIDYNADVNLPDNRGNSPLSISVIRGFYEITLKLIQRKANLNYGMGKNSTALGYALDNKRYKIALLLLKQGADDTKIRQSVEIQTGRHYTSAQLKQDVQNLAQENN